MFEFKNKSPLGVSPFSLLIFICNERLNAQNKETSIYYFHVL